MTRNEAIEKIKYYYDNAHYSGNVLRFINCLEALGLIKFDEDKKVALEAAIYFARMNSNNHDQKEFISLLKKDGYKIVPIDNVDNCE